MRLTLSIPKSHQSLNSDFLREKHFTAGPVAIVVCSLVSNECDGHMILSHTVPPVKIQFNPDGWQSFINSTALVQADYVPKFAEAIRLAHEHANKVKDWIETEIKAEIERLGYKKQ